MFCGMEMTWEVASVESMKILFLFVPWAVLGRGSAGATAKSLSGHRAVHKGTVSTPSSQSKICTLGI